jgi:hypothetical protein
MDLKKWDIILDSSGTVYGPGMTSCKLVNKILGSTIGGNFFHKLGHFYFLNKDSLREV